MAGKSALVCTRVSPDERALIEVVADAMGVTLSELSRLAVSDGLEKALADPAAVKAGLKRRIAELEVELARLQSFHDSLA